MFAKAKHHRPCVAEVWADIDQGSGLSNFTLPPHKCKAKRLESLVWIAIG